MSTDWVCELHFCHRSEWLGQLCPKERPPLQHRAYGITLCLMAAVLISSLSLPQTLQSERSRLISPVTISFPSFRCCQMAFKSISKTIGSPTGTSRKNPDKFWILCCITKPWENLSKLLLLSVVQSVTSQLKTSWMMDWGQLSEFYQGWAAGPVLQLQQPCALLQAWATLEVLPNLNSTIPWHASMAQQLQIPGLLFRARISYLKSKRAPRETPLWPWAAFGIWCSLLWKAALNFWFPWLCSG